VTPYVPWRAKKEWSRPGDRLSQPSSAATPSSGSPPSLTLDLTYNTDFAQVEVDEVRSNLTRFPLFFPEKRPFFLENAGIFSAGTPQAVEPLLQPAHRAQRFGTGPVPIIGGGRPDGKGRRRHRRGAPALHR
jgi:hypothetical protein